MNGTRDRLMYGCVAAATALVAALTWRSLGWPLIRDAPIMHYVAWLITQGEVPYRDVFDMNLPGAYLLHVGFLRVFGASPLGWRIVDLTWMLATASVLFVYCRGFADRWSAAAAAALFALYHLADGAPQAGQRDYLLCIFLIAGAYGISRSWETGGRLAPAWWGGVAVGAGLTIKPFPVFFWVACVAMAALAARRMNKAMVSVAGAFVAGSLILPACVYSWLAARGGLGDLVDILGRYLPLYGQTDRASLQAAVSYAIYHLFPVLEFGLRGERLLRLALMAAFLVFGGMLIAAALRRGAGVREKFALIGLTYGVLHFFIQGRAWPYHMYPMVLFFCVVMSVALTPDGRSSLRPVGWSSWRTRALRPVALAFLVLAIAGLGRRGLYGTEGINGTDIAGVDEDQRVEEMVADLRLAVPPDDTVQIMDTKGWAIDALLRLQLKQPTRFIYDFHFFHHQSTPYIRDLRAEFVGGLEAGLPTAILISPDYQRLSGFPEFGALLAQSYRLSVDNGHYRIYTRKPTAHAGVTPVTGAFHP